MLNRNTVARRALFAFLVALTVLISGGWALSKNANAAPGINQRINFQGRLLTSQGATVPDGYYNLQFKVYQDGDGQTAGNTTGSPAGSLKWTESYLNANGKGVLVKNGYMSVELGSITPFGSSIDWNQDTLWLSINVGSTNATCTPFTSCSPDGEMLPMRRFSSTPYALNAGMLGGRDATGFLQNGTSVQNASFNVSGTGTASTLQGNTSVLTPLLDATTAGSTLSIGTTNAATVNIATNNADHTLSMATGTGNQTVTIGSTSGSSSTTIQGGTSGVAVNTSATGSFTVNVAGQSEPSFVVGGGSTTSTLGVNSQFAIKDDASNANIMTVKNTSGNFTIETATNALLAVHGSATFDKGITVQGSTGLNYVTPLGANLTTAINIPNYAVPANGSVLAFGLPATSDSTARGLVVADARTGAHSASIGVLSPDETKTVGLSWNGNNLTAYLETTSNTLALQGGGQQLLTVTKNGSAANVGIGNNATSGYALDVTGDVNSSTQYRIGGITALTNSALTFSGATPSTIQGANNQTLTVQGGNATTTNTNGSDLILKGGTGNGTGVEGLVVLKTPTFSTTANDANCYTGGALVANSCTLAQASVDSSAAVLVGFNTIGKTATMPDPTIKTAGRIVYVTAANGSNDFSLSVNGGGMGNVISMRQNTTATMIWNGNDWTAAGASSSTTLQSAYDNTLQSAGGAELVVSKTSTTNGLTIRDSSINPVNGTLLSVQTGSAAGLFSVNSNVTEYASNAGAETAGASPATFPASTWSALSGATVSRYTTAGSNIATGQGSVSVATDTTAGSGAKNQLTSALTAKTTYNVSFAVRLGSGTFTDLQAFYSADGTAASVQCANNKAVPTSVWTKINCTFTAPASGITANNAILIRQTGAGTARTFYVDNLSVTIAADYNYASDASVNSAATFATNWTAYGGSTVTRTMSAGNDASDSAQVVTTGANQGVRNALAVNPLPSTLYRVTVYANVLSGSMSPLAIRYSPDGGTTFVPCADYNTQTITAAASAFTKVTCYITTGATTPTSPYVYFGQTDASARTFFIDTFSMTLSSNSTPNVQIGGGVNGGPTTLLTLDKGASAPIAGDNEALLGSMYYDTTLGKLQCYEADGWGACGSSPDNIVTISPEYTNAVLHGTGVGTMTSDLCSDALDINDGTAGQNSICGTNETYNFYRWTSPQPTSQSYGIYVTYQLPSTFKSFASGQTSIMGRTDSANSSVSYQIYRNSGSGLSPCGSAVTVSTGAQTTWKVGQATGASDPTTCGFNPGDSVVFKINVAAASNANAYVGNLNFTFSNR